ncbi:unnamed protein product [Ectocarpus sp. 12 AP-2014]
MPAVAEGVEYVPPSIVPSPKDRNLCTRRVLDVMISRREPTLVYTSVAMVHLTRTPSVVTDNLVNTGAIVKVIRTATTDPEHGHHSGSFTSMTPKELSQTVR